DHGASLARNEGDQKRKERLSTNDKNRQIPYFASKASSAIYGDIHDSKPLGTHDVFWQFAAFVPDAAETWLAQLKQVERSTIQAILDEVPNKRMSKIAKEFTLQLLLENQQRLLHKEQE
ncbi:hypothetical protein MNBD_PLANCTO02-265, partial [hydrothermal vent metagenome]